MPLTANFSTSESLSTLSQVTFLDTSTGSSSGLTSRRISIRLANGNWLTTAGQSPTIAYEVWPIADASISLILLTESTTATVKVEWMTDSTPTYSKTKLQEWNLYDYIFMYQMFSNQTSTPKIIQDTNYSGNIFQFISNIWFSESAVIYGDDLYSSQEALMVNQNFITNANLYF